MNTSPVAELEWTVGAWQGVSTVNGSGAFQGRVIEFKLGKREIGHVHLEGLVHIPFPRGVRDELYGAGRARPHSAGIESHVEIPFDEAAG